jgi:hypothetical protein
VSLLSVTSYNPFEQTAPMRPEVSLEVVPPSKNWPTPMDECAFHGLAGDFVRLIRGSTEADDHALLVSFLAGAGAMMGRGGYFTVEDTRHAPNLFVTVVGDSAKSRKGTGTDRVLRVLGRVDSSFVERNRVSGLSSGEGLIHAVRDPRVEEVEVKERGMPPRREMETVDTGVLDKRLLIVESEFAQALQAASREGNILSPILRDAWDGKTLRVLARSNKDCATGSHISIVANITADELKRLLTANDKANGMGNRFLWVCARRSKLLPHGGEHIPEQTMDELASRIRDAVGFGAVSREITWNGEARAAWARVYERLSAPASGLFGSMTARGDAQCRRLALIYALLDQATEIQMPHLRAALEVWSYCEDSVRYLYGTATGDETADAILRSLIEVGSHGLTTSEIWGVLGRHGNKTDLQRALNLLQERGMVVSMKEQTAGAPVTIWLAAAKKAN